MKRLNLINFLVFFRCFILFIFLKNNFCYAIICLQLIGRSVGQLFKKEVKIADLPRITLPKKVEEKETSPDLRTIFNA